MNNWGKGLGNFGKNANPTKEDVATIEVKDETLVSEKMDQNPNTEETIPVSQVADLVKKMVEEQLQKSQPVQKEKQTESATTTIIKNELFDDLPELRNFKPKERIYVLCDGSKPISRGLPTRHKDASPLQYINKETNEVYALFYSLTQTSFFKERHKGDSKVQHVFFKDGMLKTYETDIKLQKFLAIHPGNEAMGGSLFREYNPSKEAEVKIDDFELETKARNLAIDLPYLKQDAIARLLCENYKETWEPAEVKTALYQQAIKSPREFVRLANDRSIEVKGIAKIAEDRGLISYKNNRFLNEAGEVLCEVGRNENKWDVIADFFMSTESEVTGGINGRVTFEFLKNSIG